VFTARYGLIPYIKQIRLVFKRLTVVAMLVTLRTNDIPLRETRFDINIMWTTTVLRGTAVPAEYMLKPFCSSVNIQRPENGSSYN
jgi:hypothetical protein